MPIAVRKRIIISMLYDAPVPHPIRLVILLDAEMQKLQILQPCMILQLSR